MTTFTSFTAVDMPADAPASYVYNALGGVDTAGLAVGTYSDMYQDSLGYTAINGLTKEFNPPGSSNTEAVGITDNGEIFGTYIDYYNRQHGFIYANGTFTTIDDYLATDGTLIDGVNDAGVIWGTYVTDLIGFDPETVESYIDNNGTFANFNVTGADSAYISDITISGLIDGEYYDAAGQHGFIMNGSVTTTINIPGALDLGMGAMNSSGKAVGGYQDSNNNSHAFIYDNGQISEIVVPGGSNPMASGIDDAGVVVGTYEDSAGNIHGFIDSNGTVTTVDIPGASETDIEGITASGVIYGFYNDGSFQFGFYGTVPQSAAPVSGTNIDEWLLSNGHWAASADPGSHPAGYNVAAVGDWTGNGTDGILWYDPSNGNVDEWQLSNAQWSASVNLGSHPGNYQIAGVGDLFGNGIDDVLWTSTSSNGQVQTDIWKLASNGQWSASVSPGSHPAGYSVAGIGDWTGDGTDGVLWYDASNGNVDEWQLNKGQWSGSVDLGSHPANATDGASYQIAGIGDFFGNGRDDVLWTSINYDGTVSTDIWELGSQGQWINSVSPGSHPAGYAVAAVGDFTGNGTSDILWYNASTGDTDEWLINNGQWAGSVDLGTHPGNYQIAGTGSFTGNHTSDVLWAT